jgi:hypothetical protein
VTVIHSDFMAIVMSVAGAALLASSQRAFAVSPRIAHRQAMPSIQILQRTSQ